MRGTTPNAKQLTAMKGNTMSSNEIRSAIKRSESHSDIVSVAANCTTDNLRALLASIIECDWDMCEIEDNKVDVWGWTDNTPEGKQDWRIIVQCQPEQVEV
jgi:ribonuclease I